MRLLTSVAVQTRPSRRGGAVGDLEKTDFYVTTFTMSGTRTVAHGSCV